MHHPGPPPLYISRGPDVAPAPCAPPSWLVRVTVALWLLSILCVGGAWLLVMEALWRLSK